MYDEFLEQEIKSNVYNSMTYSGQNIFFNSIFFLSAYKSERISLCWSNSHKKYTKLQKRLKKLINRLSWKYDTNLLRHIVQMRSKELINRLSWKYETNLLLHIVQMRTITRFFLLHNSFSFIFFIFCFIYLVSHLGGWYTCFQT